MGAFANSCPKEWQTNIQTIGGNMDLEQLIKLSKTVAKPYMWAVGILSALLLLSVGGNIYQAINGVDVTIEQANNNSDNSINGVVEK